MGVAVTHVRKFKKGRYQWNESTERLHAIVQRTIWNEHDARIFSSGMSLFFPFPTISIFYISLLKTSVLDCYTEFWESYFYLPRKMKIYRDFVHKS